jgi:hypothetical protein
MERNSLSKLRSRNVKSLIVSCLLMPILLVASCRRAEQRPQAAHVPIAQLEQSYGRVFAVANEPTPSQNGTGDRLGLFRDDSGTVWGIPLMIDENGNLLGCAPPMLRDAPPSDTLPEDSVEIVGAANEPTGWRGGTGKLGLLLRDANGGYRWQPVAALEIKTGPVCLSQSAPVQPLQYYRLAKHDTQSAIDKGDLKLRYQPRKTPKPGSTVASNPEALKQIVANLNDRIALPWDITIAFQDCDEPDAHYDPEAHSVVICYQLIDEYYDLFAHKIKDKAKLDDAVRGAVASTFFHELGHGLVDAWKLPVTGKEEDAVDQLSTLVLINNTKNGEQMALDGAISFQLYADLERGETKIYWDEHSLDEQRFYDTICLIYGHAPDKYSYLVTNGTLPEERAEVCREEYPKVASAWRQLLSPYLNHSPEAVTPSPAPQNAPNSR